MKQQFVHVVEYLCGLAVKSKCILFANYQQHNYCLCVSPRYYIVDPILLRSGNPFEYHEEVFYLQPMIPPKKRFDIFPP